MPCRYHAGNQLAFMNSMKMKLSVTLGVIQVSEQRKRASDTPCLYDPLISAIWQSHNVQMTFGIFLSLSNHLYHGDLLAVL